MPDDDATPSVSTIKMNPVIVAQVGAMVTMAIGAFGIDVTEDWVARVSAAVATVLVVGAMAAWARWNVTPLVAPVDRQLVPLVPETSLVAVAPPLEAAPVAAPLPPMPKPAAGLRPFVLTPDERDLPRDVFGEPADAGLDH